MKNLIYIIDNQYNTIFKRNSNTFAFGKILLLIFLFCKTNFIHAQIGIGTTMPDPTAVLDVSSTTRGMLVPRMTEELKNSINTPAQGLLVYQTDQTKGFYYYDNGWIFINSAGLQGVQGEIGFNTLFNTIPENAGVNCANGGIKIEAGLDGNRNGILEAFEIFSQLTKYVCNGRNGQTGLAGTNGTNGTNGLNGRNSLVKSTTENPGANCSRGGVKLEFGIDANNNNVLDAAEINAALTKYVCNGLPSPGSFVHYIGEYFEGGVIFHLWKDSDGSEHGLIVALNHLTEPEVWSNVSGTAIGAPAKSSWDGFNNTRAIVSQAGHTRSAAASCRLYIFNGVSNWYLPSLNEMSLLLTNLFNVNRSLSTISGANQISLFWTYWTSTEDGSTIAYAVRIFDGLPPMLVQKSREIFVLPIRAF